MPAAADPELAMQLAKATLDLYARAQEQLLAIVAGRLARGIDEPGWAEAKALEQSALRQQAQAIVDQLAAYGPDMIEAAITAAAESGAALGDAEMGIKTAETFTTTNIRAVQALIDETVTNVANTHGQILRSTLDAYRDVIAHTAAPDVIAGVRTRRQAAQQALDRFADQGIKTFVDRAGKRWQLESYAEMSTRTAVGRAQVAGTLDRFEANDRDLVIVSDAPQECKLCRPWEGKVLSISGRTPGFPTVREAQAAGLQHANCRHRLGLYVPGLTRPMENTEDAEGDELRQKQRKLERNVRQWKRREAVAIDEPSLRYATAKRQQWERSLAEHVKANDLKRLRYREVPKGPNLEPPFKGRPVTRLPKPDAPPKVEIPKPAKVTRPQATPWKPQKTVKAVEDELKKRHGVDEVGKRGIGFDRLDVKTANAVAKALDEVLTAHPVTAKRVRLVGSSTYIKQAIAGLPVRVPTMRRGSYADATENFVPGQTGNGWIRMGSSMKHDELLQHRVDEEASGWAPKGCNSIESVIRHEFGHHLDFLARRNGGLDYGNAYREIIDEESKAQGGATIKDMLSGYGRKDAYEMIAEAVAEVLSSSHPRPLAKRLYDLVISYSEDFEP